MGIKVERIDQAAVIEVSGRLDMNTSPDLRQRALSLYARGHCRSLTIDFTNVSHIDTAGLATLLEIQLAAGEHCAHLNLSGLSDRVRYLIEVNGLTGFLGIVNPAREKLTA